MIKWKLILFFIVKNKYFVISMNVEKTFLFFFYLDIDVKHSSSIEIHISRRNQSQLPRDPLVGNCLNGFSFLRILPRFLNLLYALRCFLLFRPLKTWLRWKAFRGNFKTRERTRNARRRKHLRMIFALLCLYIHTRLLTQVPVLVSLYFAIAALQNTLITNSTFYNGNSSFYVMSMLYRSLHN